MMFVFEHVATVDTIDIKQLFTAQMISSQGSRGLDCLVNVQVNI